MLWNLQYDDYPMLYQNEKPGFNKRNIFFIGN